MILYHFQIRTVAASCGGGSSFLYLILKIISHLDPVVTLLLWCENSNSELLYGLRPALKMMLVHGTKRTTMLGVKTVRPVAVRSLRVMLFVQYVLYKYEVLYSNLFFQIHQPLHFNGKSCF